MHFHIQAKSYYFIQKKTKKPSLTYLGWVELSFQMGNISYITNKFHKEIKMGTFHSKRAQYSLSFCRIPTRLAFEAQCWALL